MFNTFIMNLKIDSFYSMNSYIYNLRKFPVLSDLMTDDVYKHKSVKTIGFIFGFLKNIVSALIVKGVYFGIILFLASKLKGNIPDNFLYIYLMLSLLGMFINHNNIIHTDTDKYFSIILFKMDALKYTKVILLSNYIFTFIYTFITFLLFNYKLKYSLILILFTVLLNTSITVIGEAINLFYYRKKQYPWYSNLKLYLVVCSIFILLGSLCNFGIHVNTNIMIIISIISIVLSIISYIYLISIKDYKYIYKRLNTYERIMNTSNDETYTREELVKIRNKDKEINSKKIENKHGYDLFNTIFFERHKQILYRSLRMYSIILIGIFIVLMYLIYTKNGFGNEINSIINNRIGLFALLMYFVNRGAIMTQAMFYNCDHALLNYNFYREEKTLLGLFKKRLTSLIKANIVPAIIIGIGTTVILYVTGTTNIFLLINYFIYILVLSIFFSIHYLVLYYLLQPYNKDMKITNYYYSIIVGITYVVVFTLYDIHVSGLILSTLVILFTIVYSVLSMYLVRRFAPKTFRIK